MKRTIVVCALLGTLLGSAYAATDARSSTTQPADLAIEAIAPAAVDRDVDRGERAADREYERAEHQRERTEDAAAREMEGRTKFRTDLATILVLVGTAVIFYLQWQDMKASRAVSEKALTETQRSIQISEQAVAASQQTIRISQSEILFKHALEALEKAYNLIAQTMDGAGDLDPNRGNLSNWMSAARLLVNAQYLRNRFLEEQHRLIYDNVERPRYEVLFQQLLKMPRSFETARFSRFADFNAFAVCKGLTSNDYVDEEVLSVVYHFARGWHTEADQFHQQPPFDELVDGYARHSGFEGVINFISGMRQATGRDPL